MLLLSDELIRSCAMGTNGCLDLKRSAVPLDGRVSAEWSRCLGSIARRARDSVAPLRWSSAGWMPAKIGRLSAGVGCRHPVARHRWLWCWWGEHCGTKQERSSLLCGWVHQRQGCYSQSCCSSTPTGASKPAQECDAWCQLLAKWLKVSTLRERPVQRYSEVFGLGAEGQDFVVLFDFKLTFSFLVLKVEGCRHRFCSVEL